MSRPRMSGTEILAHCGRAVDKVDRYGPRGLTLVNQQEIEALTLYVVGTGGGPACRHAATSLQEPHDD